LQFTAPKLDTAAIHSWASLAKYQGPSATLQDRLDASFAYGDPRLAPVSTALAELVRPDQALAVYHNRFGNAADFTFILVGAITPERARAFVERYLASLPSTGEHETPKPVDLKPLLSRSEQVFRDDELPRAQTLIQFDGPFPSTPDAYLRARRELDALLTVVRDRIRVRIREQLGGSYNPNISGLTYWLPQVGQSEERYRVVGGFLSAPERMLELWTEFRGILDSARTTEATPAELARAATIQRRQHETALQDNGYWLNEIQLYHRLGISLDRIIDPYGMTQVTPSELRAAAERYLPKDIYVHMTSMPEDSTSYVRRDSTYSQ
jgi:zinc protease